MLRRLVRESEDRPKIEANSTIHASMAGARLRADTQKSSSCSREMPRDKATRRPGFYHLKSGFPNISVEGHRFSFAIAGPMILIGLTEQKTGLSQAQCRARWRFVAVSFTLVRGRRSPSVRLALAFVALVLATVGSVDRAGRSAGGTKRYLRLLTAR